MADQLTLDFTADTPTEQVEDIYTVHCLNGACRQTRTVTSDGIPSSFAYRCRCGWAMTVEGVHALPVTWTCPADHWTLTTYQTCARSEPYVCVICGEPTQPDGAP